MVSVRIQCGDAVMFLTWHMTFTAVMTLMMIVGKRQDVDAFHAG